MAQASWNATDPAHLALMRQTDAELRLQGLQPDEIAELRRVQQAAPPDTGYVTVDPVRNELMFGQPARTAASAAGPLPPAPEDVTWTADAAGATPIAAAAGDQEPPATTEATAPAPTARRTARS